MLLPLQFLSVVLFPLRAILGAVNLSTPRWLDITAHRKEGNRSLVVTV